MPLRPPGGVAVIFEAPAIGATTCALVGGAVVRADRGRYGVIGVPALLGAGRLAAVAAEGHRPT